MPALQTYTLTAASDWTDAIERRPLNASMNASQLGIEVICAFPVSGQYGPGSRILYYVLVAACIFARKAVWIRDACLAGALLFPLVAALHGMVLAANHRPDAVDMDVYGAFQLCALGVLAAPVTVRRSSTYFNNPGRNIIFIWCIVVLTGLVSLTVEFYKIEPFRCTHDDFGNILSSHPNKFPYGNASCNVVCNEDDITSPLRGGSANNIYIIPAPTVINFNAATLLAAASCIPGILLLAAMWIKVLEINWQARFSTNAALGERKNNKVAKTFQKYAEGVLFGGGIVAILVVGEKNLFSKQVNYQTEPMANIGQWAPIVGTALAVLASLYVLLADAVNEEQTIRDEGLDGEKDTGLIRRIARMLLRLNEFMGNPTADRFGDNDFRRGSVLDYPVVPGEELRNPELSRTRSNYDVRRDSKDSGVSHISRLSRMRSGTVTSNDSHISSPSFDGRPPKDRRASSPPQGGSPKRRDTLEVPSPVHRNPTQDSLSAAGADTVMVAHRDSDPPTIVISPNEDT